MAPKDWIVVAGAKGARVFERDRRSRLIELAFSLHHEKSRLTTHELVSDRPGRKGRPGPGRHTARAATTQQSDPHDLEHERFARELADRLSEGADRHDFERLHLVVPPRFLGRLRPLLSASARSRVGVEEPLDLENLTDPAVIDRVKGIGLGLAEQGEPR